MTAAGDEVLFDAIRRSTLNRSMVTLRFDKGWFDQLMGLAENWHGAPECRYFMGYDEEGNVTWHIKMIREE